MRAVVIVLGLLLGHGAGAAMAGDGQLAFDRSSLGTSQLPIWSALNDFEGWAVTRMPAARAGDANALLALYMLASGDRITLEEFDALQDDMDQWVRSLPVTGEADHALRDARLLFVDMHARYLGTELASNSMPELYRENQSQLSRVFTTGEFNCISSALLYVVTARKLDFDVEGVVMPSHAFVQLRLPGKIVEIETTSFNGFDIPHDEAFYAADSGDWFSDRRLQPPTWEEYLAREIISPYELGFFNMINQHTTEERMSYQDRMRLTELRGHFLPGDQAAQKSRLAYYYQEFVHLSEQGDYTTARRMYERIGGYLASLEEVRFQDPETPVLLTAVQAQLADTLARTGSQEEGLALARELIQTRDFPESAQTVESHLFSVISGYAVDRAETDDYASARLAFNALEFQCLQNKVCNSGLAQVYSAWAMHYVKGRDWERSADIYREYLLLDSTSKLSQYFSDNLERVYLNWAATEEWEGEWETAMALLNQCSQTLQEASQCESALGELNARLAEGNL
jgi:hypothetical protein